MRFVNKDECSLPFLRAAKELSLLSDDKYADTKGIIRTSLRRIYSGRCAYCGSLVGAESSFEIEHFYPKSIQDDLIREFKNLHFSCRRCNTIKGIQDPIKEELFTPNWFIKQPTNVNNIVWKHCTKQAHTTAFKYSGAWIESLKKTSSPSPVKSVAFFNLNNELNTKPRTYLVEQRLRCYSNAFQILNLIHESLNQIHTLQKSNTDCEACISQGSFLKRQSKNLLTQFKQMIEPEAPYAEMIFDNFAVDFKKCLEIYKRLCK